MTRARLIIAALLLLLAGSHHYPEVAHPDESSLEGVRIALDWELGVLVFDGNGRRIMELKPVLDESRAVNFLHGAFYSSAYTAAGVHPGGSVLAVVRCDGLAIYRAHVHPPESVFPARCGLVLVDLTTKQETALFLPSDGKIIISLAWSRAGDRIAMLVGRDVIVIDSTSGKVLRKWDQILEYTFPDFWWWSSRSIQWNDSDDKVFVVPWSHLLRQDVASLDVKTGTVAWLDFDGLAALNGLNDEAKPMTKNAHASPDVDAMLRAVAGSTERPALQIIWSVERRYYFFVVRREGWFSKTYLAGYDTQREREFQIKTLERRLYRE